MSYFVTGGTGFIGRFFIDRLRNREGEIFVLTRRGSEQKFEALAAGFGAESERLVPIYGDLSQPDLGVSPEDVKRLSGKIAHFFHFAAIYDIAASLESQQIANIDGTRNAIGLADKVGAGCVHHVSSIAAAGLYRGTFREDMFEEAENYEHPYFLTKHDSEALVRQECKVPWRIYRPSMVVGHSETGEIDKIDGVYYFFKSLQKLRQTLPPWFPLIGLEGGKFNIVPVNYVVDAMDHIAHLPDRDGECVHLTDHEHYSLGEVVNIFANAGHTPEFSMRLDTRMFGFIPGFVRDTLANLAPVKRIVRTILNDMGLPESVLMFVDYPTRYDNRETERALKGTQISCPKLPDYAPAIWDYWERRLDPDLFVDRSLEGNIRGKTILITGASSGIGKTTALRMAEAGAHILLVARTAEKLEETAAEISELGGLSSSYTADVSDLDDCDRLVEAVLRDHSHVDILINNAGRSIRRSLELSFDGLAPSMLKRRQGHIINISSISTLTPSPRFSAYVASKSALDAWTRAAAVEFSDRNVRFTTIHMPVLTPDEAADMVVDAVIHKHKRMASRLGIFLQVVTAIAPRFSELLMNTVFRMFNDSAAARGEEQREKLEASNEQVALAALMRGVHF
jgi:NAD(P)-dependent dehydrogenase (short-subunit alcohol dehydrogenase family)